MEKTIKTWCLEITRKPGHPMETDQETLCLYQDAIGHSCAEELREIANDSKLSETFYRIYGAAYGTNEAIKFYLNNSDKITNIIFEKDEALADLEDARQIIKEEQQNNRAIKEQELETLRERDAARGELETAKQELETMRNEIIILKAKLYDLMSK